jgi:hypothetical protein
MPRPMSHPLCHNKETNQPITREMQMISIKDKAVRVAMTTSFILLLAHSGTFAETKQERVHHMSHSVMPFDMSKTIHVFRMTESGGVQKVLARDPSETEQILLIRQHLSHEAQKFGRGDFSDPTKLHGATMPGLAELHNNPSKVKVSYSELPAGAQLTFETKDLTILTAIHRWFGAQLSEHGADARAE